MRRISYIIASLYCLLMIWYYNNYTYYTEYTARDFPISNHVYYIGNYFVVGFLFYVVYIVYGRTKEEKVMYLGVVFNRIAATIFNIYFYIFDLPMVWNAPNYIMIAVCSISFFYLIRGTVKP